MAARSQRDHHMASPSSVPITRESANPNAPRLRLIQIASKARPSATTAVNVSHTWAGDGRAYGGLISARKASCHTPTSTARNTIGGSTVRTKIRPGPGFGGSWAVDSRASSPATTDRSSCGTGSGRASGDSVEALQVSGHGY